MSIVNGSPVDRRHSALVLKIPTIQASDLPKRVGIFGGQYYLKVKLGDEVHTTTVRSGAKQGDQPAIRWDEKSWFELNDGLESLMASALEVSIFARRPIIGDVEIRRTSSNNINLILSENTEPIKLDLFQPNRDIKVGELEISFACFSPTSISPVPARRATAAL
ncbi:hypothetical protein BJ138DRAFT_1175757 [Hygrophoropsis aurantiaca]|uniref:Uncharacterized protein n=1 Tax=Hygrophoropsis aurantiaca TaxID=72124 RepID=A0ACB8ASZ6_9AGAM|nr:hypothetical protein BJ138DRAFT_1175757 [Hygrophoropsis aurantiaca]